MSKAYERALGGLTPDTVLDDVVVARPRVEQCWRCRKNPSRILGIDATCEGCFAYIEGESDWDPRPTYMIRN